MRTLTLTREPPGPDGTFGRLVVDPKYRHEDALTLVTMEDDWRDNARGVSCIPSGTYRLHRTIFHRHQIETFEVTGVPGRSRILLHPANTEEDVEGCIGVGLRFGTLRVPDEDRPDHPLTMKRAVVNSREAFAALMGTLRDTDEAELRVVWGDGVAR